MSSNNNCPVCESLGSKPIYDFDEYKVVCCNNCKVMHLSPIPSFSKLEEIYANDYYSGNDEAKGYVYYNDLESSYHKTYLRRLKLAKNFISNQRGEEISRIHEIGCALGYGISAFKEVFNSKISVSDISEEALDTVSGNNVLVLKSDSFGRCELSPESVDLMVAFDVIEHLPKIRKFKSWLTEVIKPGGYLLLATPDFSSIYNRILGKNSPSIIIPEHLIYFKTSTLKSALQPEFKCETSWIDFQKVPIELILNKILKILRLPVMNRPEGSLLKTPTWTPNGMQLYLFKRRA